MPETLIVAALILVGFPIWGIIDAATRPDSEWAAADQNKIVWLLVQVFLWVVGSLVYFLAIRPKLSRATVTPADTSGRPRAES